MNKIIISSLFFLITTFSLNATIERRAAIDIGSGGTKVAIADVDTDNNQIVQLIFEHSYPVAYQASLDKSNDGTFDSETISKGLHTFKEIKKLTGDYQVERIAAIATSAFRKSNNAKELVKEVKEETGINITIIPQREEGEIAYFSAMSMGAVDPNKAVVWDIGTGSMQMTTVNHEGGLSVYMGENMGSVAFKSFIVGVVQGHENEDNLSPNPINEEELKQADSYARSFGRKAYPIVKEKIKTEVPVVGIGRLFYNSLRPIAGNDQGIITRSGLRRFISNSLNKTDAELNNPYASVDVTNAILVLAVMKSLHIHEIVPIQTTTTHGLLVSPDYWSVQTN